MNTPTDLEHNFRSKSFWLTTSSYTPNEPLKDIIKTDVAVIGGGFTGLTTSYFLKQKEPSLKVTLLESEVIGYGASGRNAGFSMTKWGMEHSMTKLRFGKRRCVEAHEYSCRAVDLQRELIESLNLDCDYEYTGFLWVATSPGQLKHLEHEYETATQTLGLSDIHWIDEQELKSRINSPMYHGGAWWEPRTGILNPAKLAWSWKRVIEAAGVHVFEQTSATEIKKNRNGYTITTPNGEVHARKVVLATNAWTHQFTQMKQRQMPIWTYIVLTEPLSDQQFEQIGWQGREGIEDARNLVHYYRLTADNRIVFGGRDVGLSFSGTVPTSMDQDPAIFEGLKSDLLKTFPQLKGIKFTHQWGGPVSATMDLAPALGYADGKDMVYSMGCMGHAVSTTHLNGDTLSDLILERDTELTQSFFVNRRIFRYLPQPLNRPIMRSIAGYMRWDDKRRD